MEKDLRLKIVGCAIPGVTRIQIGTEERCTLEIPSQKRFLYDLDVVPSNDHTKTLTFNFCDNFAGQIWQINDN